MLDWERKSPNAVMLDAPRHDTCQSHVVAKNTTQAANSQTHQSAKFLGKWQGALRCHYCGDP